MSKRKTSRNDQLYEKWLRGVPLKDLKKEFGISRQRIYQTFRDRGLTDREKTLRVVNKLSR